MGGAPNPPQNGLCTREHHFSKMVQNAEYNYDIFGPKNALKTIDFNVTFVTSFKVQKKSFFALKSPF